MKSFFQAWGRVSLVLQIIIGLAIGIAIAIAFPDKFTFLTLFGELFVKALKAIAPLMVFILVIAALANHKQGQQTNMTTVISLYLVSTVCAGAAAVVASFLFPIKMTLAQSPDDIAPPTGILEVLKNVVNNIVDNPINAILNANFLGVLAWAIVLGLAFRLASDGTKTFLSDASEAVTKAVRWVIRLAPFGIMGLVYTSITTSGLSALKTYKDLIIILVCTMLFIAFVINPLIVFICTRRNPYPLVWKCIRVSGLTAFFTRSSAANIPVNMDLCEKLGLDENTYPISIPLGATINMAGAAVTIAVMSLSACYTAGVQVDILSAILLIFLAAISAAGASGVPGGSLLLIPLACSLFGLPPELSYQVVAVGFIVGVIQDSCETALNSSTDVLLTATAEIMDNKHKGIDKQLNI